jgi:hypothetical protein
MAWKLSKNWLPGVNIWWNDRNKKYLITAPMKAHYVQYSTTGKDGKLTEKYFINKWHADKFIREFKEKHKKEVHKPWVLKKPLQMMSF